MPPIWLDRFASYFRIWSPVYGLAADLTAYRATLLEQHGGWDRRFGTSAPDDPGYSKEEQAEGYATFALFHFASFEWELRQFKTLFGGQWLLSDAEAEQAVADAVYQISWHTPWNERDQSYLRTVIAATPEWELHGFLDRLRASELGRASEREWHDWAAACECSWLADPGTEDEHFPTSRRHERIAKTCALHSVVAASCDYLELIDRDWRRLADWYHIDASASRGVSGTELYRKHGPTQPETK